MKRLLLALLCVTQLHAMELIERNSVSSADDALQLYTNNKDFFVEDDNAAYRVERHNINPLLNEVMKRQALGKFKDAGYLRISKLEDGKYALSAHVRGEGGTGPITAWCVGTTVKAACWIGVMVGSGLIYKASEKIQDNKSLQTGSAVVGINGAAAMAGGWSGIAATIEGIGNGAAAATLALPWPLP